MRVFGTSVVSPRLVLSGLVFSCVGQINKSVDFPMYGLDLLPFIQPSSPTAAAQEQEAQTPSRLAAPGGQ